MIVSHARKFIFVKTIKTAGSSLEIALSRHCGPDDVLTPLIPEEEALRRRLHGVGARNHLRPWRRHRPRELARALKRGGRLADFEEHSSAYDIRARLAPEVWRDYFKFTIVRNPFDRLLSRFYYTRNVKRNFYTAWDTESVEQFIRYKPELVCENWYLYTENDKPILDFFVRYENLRDDLAVVSARIGLASNLFDEFDAIRAKSTHRPRDARARALGDTERRLVALLCEQEIALFGYDPAG